MAGPGCQVIILLLVGCQSLMSSQLLSKLFTVSVPRASASSDGGRQRANLSRSFRAGEEDSKNGTIFLIAYQVTQGGRAEL